MSWNDDPDLMSGNDGDGQPKTSILGDMRRGDEFVLSFNGDGEVVERDHGKAATFPVTLEEIDGTAFTWDDEELEEGEDYSFETSSSPLLGELAGHRPVDGKTLRVEIVETGFDANYEVTEV